MINLTLKKHNLENEMNSKSEEEFKTIDLHTNEALNDIHTHIFL